MAKKTKPLQLVEEIDPPVPDAVPTPPGLAPDGARMWQSITTEFRIDDCAARLLLEQACHALDMAMRLRAQVDKDGLMVLMQSGMRTHPAIREELGYRSFVASALKRLGVLEENVQQHGGAYKRYGFA